MKYKLILATAFLFLVFLNSSEAICCGTGCFANANVCCTPAGGGPTEGYVGCYDINLDDNGIIDPQDYVCPEAVLGACLTCGNCDDITRECEWTPTTQGECNGCETTYDDEGFPAGSMCTTGCPEGEQKCEDETCQIDCSVPSCSTDGSDGECCINANPDGVCDPNCVEGQDLDCGGGGGAPFCGDNLCDANEDCSSCSSDCGVCSPSPACGDNVCDPNEDCNSCSSDCGTCDICTNSCSDGCCDAGENCNSCSSDCGVCEPSPTCGDNLCAPNENCNSCSSDCGVCEPSPTCGDSICDPNEDCNSCSLDCGICQVGGGECTAAEGDCCLPASQGNTCDLDCPTGVDPNCNEGASKLKDNLCNADLDDACDPDCLTGIDPDCAIKGIACTSQTDIDGIVEDCCSPLVDDICDLDCPFGIDPDCDFAHGVACDNDGDCDSNEGCGCSDCQDTPELTCVSGLSCCGLTSDKEVCSGDVDNDEICDFLDYCINVPDTQNKHDKQDDTDTDCYVNGERSLVFGNCGDQCDFEDRCFDAFGSKQCCNDLGGTTGIGTFFGFTSDCGYVEGQNSVGCWSTCVEQDGENTITYEIGQCIEGTRIVTKLVNKVATESFEEVCTSIPLIPFYTNFSIAITFLILAIYYISRKK